MLLDAAEPIDEPELSPIRKRRRGLWVLACLLLVLVVMPGALAAVVAYQLTQSTLRLDFARSQMEGAVRARLPADATVEIGSAFLSYRPGIGLQLRADSLRLDIPHKATLEIGKLTTAASMAALFGGKLDLRSVLVEDTTISLRPSGLLPKDAPASAFNTNTSGSQADTIRRGADRVARTLTTIDEGLRRAGLREVRISNSSIVWGEEGSDPLRTTRIADATWAPVSAQRSKSWVQVLGGDGRPWDLTLERESAEQGSSVVLRVDNLPTGEIAPALADPNRRPSFPALVSAETRIALAHDGKISALSGAFSTGAGQMQLSRTSQVQIAGISLTFLLPGEGDQLSIPRAEVHTKAGEMAFSLTANLGADPSAIRIAGAVLAGSLPTERDNPASLRLNGGTLNASVDRVGRSLRIDKLDLATEVGTISLIGQASSGGSAAGLSFAMSVGEIPAVYARALWPPFIASKTRKWFDENVESGMVGPATMQVALPPEFIGTAGVTLPHYGLVGTLPFHDAVFSPLNTFPKIHNGVGTIAFADAAATMTVRSGVMPVPGFGDVDPSGTVLIIREIGNSQPHGDLHLQLSGPAAAVAALSNTPPVDVAQKRGIEPSDLSGSLQLSLDTDVPLFDTPGGPVADLKPSFRMTLNDFASKAAISGRMISDADLVLEGTSDSYTVKGQAKLDGVPATVDLLTGSGNADQTDVKMTLDDAARKRLGLTFGGYVSGPIQAAIRQVPGDKQQIVLDLQNARISLDFLGWEKGPGVPATARFEMQKMPDGVSKVDNLVLEGKAFAAKGNLSVGKDGNLAQLSLSEVSLRPGDKLSFRATAKDGGYDVAIAGDVFDGRGLLEQIRSGFGKANTDGVAIRASIDVGTITGKNNVVLRNVTGSLAITGSKLERAAIRGTTSDSGGFEWTVGKEGTQRVLRLLADDGGALIRGLGMYDKISGGNLVIDYSGSAVDQAGTGSLVMRNFRLVGEDALAPAIQTAAHGRQDSSDVRGAPIDAKNMHIDQLTVPFRREGWIFAIGDASVRSPMIGATASGTLNLTDGKIALSGTFIPAFGLNNIAASVPILGTILGGGRNEGLLGITYKLFGPLERPQLAMNPLSAIAPGIFRKMFDYR